MEGRPRKNGAPFQFPLIRESPRTVNSRPIATANPKNDFGLVFFESSEAVGGYHVRAYFKMVGSFGYIKKIAKATATRPRPETCK